MSRRRPVSSIRRLGFTVLLLLLTAAVPLCAQIKVGVLPMHNSGGSQYTAAVESLTRTIQLTLSLLGGYEVSRIDADGVAAVKGIEDLRRLAEDRQLDVIVLGEFVPAESGAIEISASIYERFHHRITVSVTEESRRILDIFDASDRLVFSLLEDFSGQLIRFGEITLVPPRAAYPYTVRIDGVEVGQNLLEVPRVLAGTRSVEIVQERMFGPTAVFSSRIDIADGGTSEIAFEFPGLTATESDEVERVLALVDHRNWTRSAAAETAAAFAYAEDLFADTQYTTELDDYPSLIDDMRACYAVYETRWRLEDAVARRDATAAVTEAVDSIGPILNRANTLSGNAYADRCSALSENETNLRLTGTIIALAAARYMHTGNFDQAAAVYARLAPYLSHLGTDASRRYTAETVFLNDALVQSRLQPETMTSGIWPAVLYGTGTLAAGAGVMVMALEFEQDLIAETNALLLEYNTSTDPAEVTTLREEISNKITWANVLGIGKWVSIGVGAGLYAVGTARLLHEIDVRNAGGPRGVYLRDTVMSIFAPRARAAYLLFSPNSGLGATEEAGEGSDTAAAAGSPSGSAAPGRAVTAQELFAAEALVDIESALNPDSESIPEGAAVSYRRGAAASRDADALERAAALSLVSGPMVSVSFDSGMIGGSLSYGSADARHRLSLGIIPRDSSPRAMPVATVEAAAVRTGSATVSAGAPLWDAGARYSIGIPGIGCEALVSGTVSLESGGVRFGAVLAWSF